MTVDLRRFHYALDPLLQRRRWQLEALTAELGHVQRQLSERQQEAAELRDRLREGSRRAGELARRVDPGSYPRALAWLVQLRGSIQVVETAVAELEAERDRVRVACLEQQQKVDVIERHREECLAEFAQGEAARMASELDREWLSRRPSKKHHAREEGT